MFEWLLRLVQKATEANDRERAEIQRRYEKVCRDIQEALGRDRIRWN